MKPWFLLGLLLVAVFAWPADAGLGKMTLDWTTGCVECRTEVYRFTGTCASAPAVDTWSRVADVAPGALQYIDLPLGPNLDVCYAVRHTSGADVSAFSNSAGGRTGGAPSALTVR
jgi:hypothetical protein